MIMILEVTPILLVIPTVIYIDESYIYAMLMGKIGFASILTAAYRCIYMMQNLTYPRSAQKPRPPEEKNRLKMNGALGHDSASVRLYWAGDNMG